jgi:branched-chain amino acid transport system ATP-binding protein
LIDDMYDNFTALAAEGIGVLIIDQNIERALTATSRFYVVEDGRIVADGSCSSPGVLAQVTHIVLAQAGSAPRTEPASRTEPAPRTEPGTSTAPDTEPRLDDVTTV